MCCTVHGSEVLGAECVFDVREACKQTGMKAHEIGRKPGISPAVAWCTRNWRSLKAVSFEATGFDVAC